jgi:tetratricopeptide (TPR) repeat protein
VIRRMSAEPGEIAAKAQELIYDAWEAWTPGLRISCARRALKIDPRAIDGFVLLALHAVTSPERIALLREALRIGSVVWAPLLERPPEGFFWGELNTRPYMRANHDLALALWECGERAEAIALADHLLRINPNDNQGVRYLALTWNAALANWPKVEEILERYRGEAATEYAYAKCLNAYRTGSGAEEALAGACAANPFVPGLLLKPGLARVKIGEYVVCGSEEEALSYVRRNRVVWKALPGALPWLRQALKKRRLS